MTIRIDGTNTAANPGITGTDTDTGLSFGTNEVSINTDGTERFRVGSAGQFGIGGATYGTDGQVLTSTGATTAPAWEDLPAAAWTNHGQTTTTSGSAHTVTGISTDARTIVIAYSNLSLNSGTTPQLRLLMGNGSISSSDYYWATQYSNNNQFGNADTSIRLVHTDFNNAGNSYSGVITLVAEQTYMVGTHIGQMAGGWGYIGNIRWAGGGSIDRIQIATAASAFDAGHFVVYSL